MAEYHLITIWHIAAPLEKVYGAIRDSLDWPAWWSGAEDVEQTAPGDALGLNSVRRYVWRGVLPYTLAFEVRVTHIDELVAIEGNAWGDLNGVGRWHFARAGSDSIVRCEWHVRSTKWWMNLVAPVARRIFIRNHERIMSQGGQGLARRLGATLLSQENIDLMSDSARRDSPPVSLKEGGWIDPPVLLMAAFLAGTLATLAELVLWWLAGMPVLETLLRDSYLTVALVMGAGILAAPTSSPLEILAVATLVHFALSIVYAVVPAMLVERLSTWRAPVAGALYGLMIYVVNLHGLTLLFPWFVVTRGGITLAAHLVFGMALMGASRFFSGRKRRTSNAEATP